MTGMDSDRRRELDGEGGRAGPKDGWIGKTETFFERLIFWTRWLLAPTYAVLSACLATLAYKTVEEFVQLITGLHVFDETRAILQVLTIVDLVLVLNLVLLIIFVGYVNFVSKIHPPPHKREDWPRWMGRLDYSGLKVQLMGSIIAIASVKMLRTFIELIDVGRVDADKLLWMVILYVAFLLAILIIAIVNKLKVHSEDDSFTPDEIAEERRRPETRRSGAP